MALHSSGLEVKSEVPFIVNFVGEEVGKFRVDILVSKKVVVEVKAIGGKMPKIFQAQVISYLKASGLQVGLLLNFGNPSLEFERIVY